jgi:hypothetical protein
MTELLWEVRVKYAFMAAVLIGPTTKTTTTYYRGTEIYKI